MPQLTYYLNSPAALPGYIADALPKNVRTYASVGVIDFGIGVQRDSTDPQNAVVPYDATGVFAGISVLSQEAFEQEYINGAAVPVISFGDVYMTTTDAVTAGEGAYLTAANALTNVVGTNLLIGNFLTTGTGLVAVHITDVG